MPTGVTADHPRSSDLPAEPVFVVCNARSGSTLLRYLLDSHPDIAAPAETKVAHAARLLLTVENDLAGNASLERLVRRHGVPQPTPESIAAVRDTLGRSIRGYLDRRGKTVWCDKSLETLQVLDVIRRVFPNARYLCLHRHAMDVVASLVESCRWGYAYFEVQPYVARRLNNVPLAFVEYWTQRTGIMAQLEESDASTLSVHYEHLVRDPVATLARILEFLGLPRDQALVQTMAREAFGADAGHDVGAADWKIPYASAVGQDSVERGRSVSVDLIKAPLRDQMNSLLSRMGYPLVGTDWNTSSELGPRVDRRLLTATDPAARVATLLDRLLAPRLADYAGPTLRPVLLCATYGDGQRAGWVIDSAARTFTRVDPADAGDGLLTVTTRAEVLLELLVRGLAVQTVLHQDMAVISGIDESSGAGGADETDALGRLLTALLAT